MQLSEKGLVQDKAQWEAKGYNLPKYDHETMVERTKENPWTSGETNTTLFG